MKGNFIKKLVCNFFDWECLYIYIFFCNRDDTNDDIFVHQSAVIKNNPLKYKKSVGEGEKIEFDIVQGEKGLEAANVTGPNGEPVQGSKYAADRNRRRFQRGSSNRRYRRRSGRRGQGNAESGAENVAGENSNEANNESKELNTSADGDGRRPMRRRVVRRRRNQRSDGADNGQGQNKNRVYTSTLIYCEQSLENLPIIY